MRISVVIPYRNAAATLRRCVDRLLSGERPPDEIVLVDDASEDNGFGTIEDCGGLIHIRNLKPMGAAYARNVGARAASGDAFLFVDADVLPGPDALKLVEQALGAEQGLAGVFGAYTIETEPGNFATVYKNLVHHYTHISSAGKIGTFWAGFGALRRAAFEAVGGFDQGYDASSVEDIDLGYRLRSAGFNVRLAPEIQVTHVKPYTLRSLILSDIKSRAIPWTRLMVRRRTFRPELNLSLSNLLAAGTAATLPVIGLILLLMGKPAWALGVLLASILGWVGLNLGILRFVASHRGLAFAIKFGAMHILSHIYSVAGLGIGVAAAIFEKEKN